ncbi:MAG: hypothetical protein OXH28_00400 [bacterium]|nr:hypothetical protein [bacterium]
MTETDVKTAVLHRKIAEHMGTETADALIERLPPDWEQLATKTDVARLEAQAAALEATVEAKMGALQATLEARAAALEATVEARMGALESTLGSALATGVESLQAELGAMEGRLERRAARDLRAVLFAFAGFALAVMGMFVTVLVAGVPVAG